MQVLLLQESQGRLVMKLERGDGDFLRLNVRASLSWIGVVSGYCGKLLIPKEPNP